jgi:hypothetical protein
MELRYPEIGICGLSCRLCPNYHMGTQNRCHGCKSAGRMAVGCPFITCAIKGKGVEFCWECNESKTCKKWKNHRAAGKKADSFKCYQMLEHDISFILKNGVADFEKSQKAREVLLREMLDGFSDGRSKSYYCIASTVLEIGELNRVLFQAKKDSKGMEIKERSKLMHSLLDEVAALKGYNLKLRK